MPSPPVIGDGITPTTRQPNGEVPALPGDHAWARSTLITSTHLAAGAITLALTDFLDAQRSFISTNLEYRQHVNDYWTAIYQLEMAVGEDLRQ